MASSASAARIPTTTLVGDEQRARPVRDRRPARRQHPRTPGHGVLRLQRARRDVRRRAVLDSRRRVGRERRTDHRVDRCASSRRCSSKGFTEQEIDESKSYLIGSLPRQLETNAASPAFLLNAETLRPRPRLRRAAAGAARRGHRTTRPCRGAGGCSIRPARPSPSPGPGTPPRVTRGLGSRHRVLQARCSSTSTSR